MCLDFLTLDGNPLSSLPVESLESGTEEILKLLDSIHLQHLSRPRLLDELLLLLTFGRTKLTVIGDTKAGKTSLINSLSKKWGRSVQRGQQSLIDEEAEDGQDVKTYDEERVEMKMSNPKESSSVSSAGGGNEESNDGSEDDPNSPLSSSSTGRQEEYRISIQKFNFEKLNVGTNTPRRITGLKVSNLAYSFLTFLQNIKKRKQKVLVNVWDFDKLSNDVYVSYSCCYLCLLLQFSTHHLFFSPGSVFLLVFRLSDPFTSITFWLQSLVVC